MYYWNLPENLLECTTGMYWILLELLLECLRIQVLGFLVGPPY